MGNGVVAAKLSDQPFLSNLRKNDFAYLPRPRVGHFWRKNYHFDIKGCLWKRYFFKELCFFPKNHTFSICIWNLHILSFLLRHVCLKFSNSQFLAIKFQLLTCFTLWTLATKLVIKRNCFRYLLSATDQKYSFEIKV